LLKAPTSAGGVEPGSRSDEQLEWPGGGAVDPIHPPPARDQGVLASVLQAVADASARTSHRFAQTDELSMILG